MGHVRIAGLDVTVEFPEGSVRKGVGKDGTPWMRQMHAHYGYIKRTTGADDEQVDVYIGPNHRSLRAFVVDQVDAAGKFDEHKILLGYTDRQSAKEAYSKHFPPDFKIGPIKEVSVARLRAWLDQGDLSKPVNGLLGVVPRPT
ncbi:hypothetical protein C4F17_12140 [Variovorax sp. PMC12]|nr:hypothetical protein C4F17_12140 [Variovorax sp. PMC12]